jgi:hypothetical protein
VHAYVVRVDNSVSVAHVAASVDNRASIVARGVDAVGLRNAGLRYVLFGRHAGSRDLHKLTICSEC